MTRTQTSIALPADTPIGTPPDTSIGTPAETSIGTPGDTSIGTPAKTAIAIIDGAIGHARHRPARNAFSYRAFCLRIPLSRLDELGAAGIGSRRFSAVGFDARDHGARDGSPLRPWIDALLAREGIVAGGEVVLHTFPRMFGYVFNPVSFWLCHDAEGNVKAIVAEVCNTFGERHNYLLAHADGHPIAGGETLHARKVFHVSPFCEVKGEYRFRFHFAGDRWLARIDYFDDAGNARPVLETWISGSARPATRAAMRKLPWRYMAFTFAVVARIHWHALKLWWKRVPFFAKPVPPAEATTR